MNDNDSAIRAWWIAPRTRGTVLAALGVLSFSFSFPATVWSLEGFGPWTSTGLRGVLAAALACLALLTWWAPLPTRAEWAPLAVVALGCVVGFPLLTTLALQTSSTSHSAVVIGALPMATAAISALRTRRHSPPMFWAAAAAGAVTVTTFALLQNGGSPTKGDLYLVAALIACAAGYAEGGRLAVRLSGWRVIAWAVLMAAPVNLVVAIVGLRLEPATFSAQAIGGLIYIAAVSQFGGFALWYGGMSLIGVPRASQLQLAQPLLTVVWAVLLMGEALSPATPIAALIVIACIVATQRAKDALPSGDPAPPSAQETQNSPSNILSK